MAKRWTDHAGARPLDAFDEAPGARRRARDRDAAPHKVRMPMSFTEADKYHWMRANRGSYELREALREARSDADFDALIEAAMRMSVASPGYFGDFGDLPNV
jgi:hypothetical protein